MNKVLKSFLFLLKGFFKRMSFRSSGGMENARRSNSDLHEGGPRRRGSANNFASCEQGGNSSKPGARPQIRREEISKLKNYMGQGLCVFIS